MDDALQRSADAALAKGDIAGARALLEALAAQGSDFATSMKLAAVQRRTGDLAAALDTVNRALDLQIDFVALLLKASLLEQLGDAPRAAEIYRAALFHAPDAASLPRPVAARLDHARRFLGQVRAAIDADLRALPAMDAMHRARAHRFADNVLDRRAVFHQQPTHYRYPGLADQEFFDGAYPALADRMRAAFPAIRAEFEALLAAHGDRQAPYVDFAPGQPMGQWKPLNRSASWNALHLVRYGEVDPVNAAACPETIRAFSGDHQPDIAGLAPNLMFSLLAPQTRIPPHHGVANFRSVLHLPLIVPPGCAFRVGADSRAWVEGQPWIFDDTIEHAAWNESGALRVVLIGDLWRPELDEQDKAIVRALVAAQGAPGRLGAL
ncbi:aspartyl/asparaginyl beta-hydroxylase domain-containing protein [Novosphingobium lentum]|uniref:aspartyl/asparaginyl beta-hydroxylase domain-containing protein n=1 Tax=Novosphingobium lentum TaxID=145287 RepID=UPI00082BB13F|nr:aspartyl/asparaginyl beta-hydroxylase domain-containing protein [Novosphingobium lentum]